jgi:regulator of replication initiation timing
MGNDNLDRFDFEQQLMDCWRITDDIRDASEALLEGNLNTDETSNILIGLRQLYELKFNKLWDMFEGVIMPIVRENTILNDECTALRQQLMEATEMVPVITTKKGKK